MTEKEFYRLTTEIPLGEYEEHRADFQARAVQNSYGVDGIDVNYDVAFSTFLIFADEPHFWSQEK